MSEELFYEITGYATEKWFSSLQKKWFFFLICQELSNILAKDLCHKQLAVN